MRNREEEAYWRQYATDVYLLERQRRWELAANQQTAEDWRNLCRGVRSVCVIYGACGMLALVIFLAVHYSK